PSQARRADGALVLRRGDLVHLHRDLRGAPGRDHPRLAPDRSQRLGGRLHVRTRDRERHGRAGGTGGGRAQAPRRATDRAHRHGDDAARLRLRLARPRAGRRGDRGPLHRRSRRADARDAAARLRRLLPALRRRAGGDRQRAAGLPHRLPADARVYGGALGDRSRGRLRAGTAGMGRGALARPRDADGRGRVLARGRHRPDRDRGAPLRLLPARERRPRRGADGAGQRRYGLSGLVRRLREQRLGRGPGVGDRADVAGELAALLDRHLAVADLARDAPGGADHELPARRELAVEAAADLGDVDADLADEHAVLGDLDDAAVHRGLDAAFDDQGVAIGDFGAFQLDVGTDDELADLLGGFLLLHGCLRVGFGGLHLRLVGRFLFRELARGQGFLELAVGALVTGDTRAVSPAKTIEHLLLPIVQQRRRAAASASPHAGDA